MKLSAPKYYGSFKCIADKCQNSCCVGWEIDLDPITLDKYSSLSGEYSDKIRECVNYDGAPHIALLDNGRCPHLDECGLCRIISHFGEGYLSDICREHPRFYNLTASGLEVGLGACCVEAARIILSSDDYAVIEPIADADGTPSDFDTGEVRGRIYSILSDRTSPYAERLSEIYSFVGISPLFVCDGEWRELISSLEYLRGEDRELFSDYSSELIPIDRERDVLCERALAYFVYRHVGAASSFGELKLSLGLAFFLERLFASLLSRGEEDAAQLLRVISEEIEYSPDNCESIEMQYL